MERISQAPSFAFVLIALLLVSQWLQHSVVLHMCNSVCIEVVTSYYSATYVLSIC